MTTPARTSAGWWQDVDSDAAEAYERYLVPAIFAGWATDLVDLAAPGVGDRVLDIACGTGIVARTAAPRVGPSGHVVGLDINPGMLDVARRASRDAGDRISWEEGRAESLPFDDHSFDIVICQQGLQFSVDRSAAVREMRRVLATRGRLVVAVWAGAEQHAGWNALLRPLTRHLDREIVGTLDAPHALGDLARVRTLLADGGLSDYRIELRSRNVRFPSPEGLLQQLAAINPPLLHAIAEGGEEQRAALIAEVEEAMQPHIDDDGVTFPFESYVIRSVG